MKTIRRMLAGAIGLSAPLPALACTLCHTPTAREVRHVVLEHGFAGNLMALALPLPILLAVVYLAALERAPPARRGTRR